MAGNNFWVPGGDGNWSSTSNWSASSGGASGAAVPTAAGGKGATFDANSGTGTCTIDASATPNNITATNFGGTITGSASLAITSALTLGTGLTWSYSGALSWSGASGTLVCAGKTLANMSIAVSGTFQLNDAASVSGAVTHTGGTFACNNQNSSFGSFASTGATARVIQLGTGTMTLTGTGTVWELSGSNWTLTEGTSTITIADTGASGKTFTGASETYNNLTITAGGAGAVTIQGSNTFGNFTATGGKKTITLTPGTTQTANAFAIAGTAGNLVTLQTGGATAALSQSAGTVSGDYLDITDVTAGGGATFDATNSTGHGDTTGWNITAPASVPDAPGSPDATADADSINLSWTTPGDDGGSAITGYKVYRGTSSGMLSLYQTLGVTLSYDDTSVTPGTTYYYAFKATNAIGDSTATSEVSDVVIAGGGALGGLSGLSGLSGLY